MNNDDLHSIYESTEEDLRYGIGMLALPNQRPVPVIQICYKDWSHEKLEVVRESFRDGLILVSGRRPDATRDFYVGTRERIAIQSEESGHTSVLRAPAWDAHLEYVDEAAALRFEAERKRYGGFLLLIQTPELEFLTAVDDVRDRTHVGVVLPASSVMPTVESPS